MISFGSVILSTGSGAWLETLPNPNPLNLPPFTMRFEFGDPAFDPTADQMFYYGTWTQVSSYPNVWDFTKTPDEYVTDWSYTFNGKFSSSDNPVKVLGANTTGVTSMKDMFRLLPYLTEVALFDTSSVTDMSGMFWCDESLVSVGAFSTGNVTDMSRMFLDCKAIASVPAFNTERVVTMREMFSGAESLAELPAFETGNVANMAFMLQDCYLLREIPAMDTHNALYLTGFASNCIRLDRIPTLNVGKVGGAGDLDADTQHPMGAAESAFASCPAVSAGILSMYNALSSNNHLTSALSHHETFAACGIDTVSGAAELAQIPSGWK